MTEAEYPKTKTFSESLMEANIDEIKHLRDALNRRIKLLERQKE